MKKTLSVFMAVLMIMALALSVSASPAYVDDQAGILSQDEIQILSDQAEAVTDNYGYGVYVVTVEDYNDLEGAGSIEDAAQVYFENGGYGLGEKYRGIMLMLSMENRKYALYYDGDTDNAFDGLGQDYLSGEFLDDFGEDQWFEGFQDYISACDYILENAENGVTFENNPPHARAYGIAVCIVLGFVAAFIVRGVLKGQLTSVSEKTEAAAFIDGSLQLRERQDLFLYMTKDRVYDPPQKDSSSDSDSDSGSSSGDF